MQSDAKPTGDTPAVPAVPDKVAPMCEYCGAAPCCCDDPNCICRLTSPLPAVEPCPHCGEPKQATHHVNGYCYGGGSVNRWLPIETQDEAKAGVEVPSQDEVDYLRGEIKIHVDNLTKLRAHLATIRSYVLEAAKTPISREDMHDPMKAQTYYDEHEGLGRLILSETGYGK